MIPYLLVALCATALSHVLVRVLRLRWDQPGFLTLLLPFSRAGRLLAASARLNLQPLVPWREKFDLSERCNTTVATVYALFKAKPTVLVADAEAVKSIVSDQSFIKLVQLRKLFDWSTFDIVSSEGEIWRRHRKIVMPAMGELNNLEVWKTTYELCQGWFQRLEEGSVRDETVVEITSVMRRLTLMLISSAGFGTSLDWPDVDGREHVPFGHTLSFTQALSETLKNVNRKLFLPKWAFRLPITRLRHARLAFQELESYMQEMIEDRNADHGYEGVSSDILSNLIAENEAKGEAPCLSRDEIFSNMLSIVFVGRASANGLSAALILLALHPEHQDLIHQEANSVFSPFDGSPPPYSCFSKLRYTTATFQETLRLFPPTTMIAERATEDRYLPAHLTHSKLGEPTSRTIFVPSGSSILLLPRALHYNSALWPDPTTFRPSRFTDTTEYTWDRSSFLAFSSSPRSCAGRDFSTIEAALFLACVVRRYHITFATEGREKEYKVRCLIGFPQATSSSGGSVGPGEVRLAFKRRSIV